MLEILTLQMRCPFFESGNISKFIIPASDTFSLLPTYPNDWILDYRFHKFVNQIREEGKESKNMVYDPQLSTSPTQMPLRLHKLSKSISKQCFRNPLLICKCWPIPPYKVFSGSQSFLMKQTPNLSTVSSDLEGASEQLRVISNIYIPRSQHWKVYFVKT